MENKKYGYNVVPLPETEEVLEKLIPEVPNRLLSLRQQASGESTYASVVLIYRLCMYFIQEKKKKNQIVKKKQLTAFIHSCFIKWQEGKHGNVDSNLASLNNAGLLRFFEETFHEPCVDEVKG